MTVIIPGMTTDQKRVEICPRDEIETLLECYKMKNMDNLLVLLCNSIRIIKLWYGTMILSHMYLIFMEE